MTAKSEREPGDAGAHYHRGIAEDCLEDSQGAAAD